MDNLKRIIPVIALALVLVLAVGQPMQVFALADYLRNNKSDELDFADFYVSSTVNDGYTTYLYELDSLINRTSYYVSTTNNLYDEGSRIFLSFSDTSASNLYFYFSCVDAGSDLSSTSYKDFLYFTDVCSVEDFASAKLTTGCRLLTTASSSATVTATLYVAYGLSGNTYATDKKSVVKTATLAANGSAVFSFEFNLSELPSDAAWIYPYISIRVVSPPAGDYTVNCNSFQLRVFAAEKFPATPVISSNNIPSSPVYYLKGDTCQDLVVFHSFGDGEVGDVTVQWYKSTTGSTSDGVAISGANTYLYTPSASTLGTSYYYCVITNTYDGKVASTTSPVACIKVINAPTAPQITQNLSSAIMEYTQGDTASPFVISAINSGDGTLSYQWYSNTTNSNSGGTKISGATKSSYTPSTATVGTKYYYCVVANSVGSYSESVTSNVGAVRVVAPPDPAQAPVINPNLSTSIRDYYIGDSAQELKIGASVTDGGTLTYQWYSNTTASNSGGTLLPGETDRTFTPPTDTLGTRYYYCVVTNTLPDSTASTASNVATVRVNELPKASAPVISVDLPKDPIVYTQGDAASAVGISARAPDGGILTYQWYKNDVAENSGGTLIPGADGPSYEPDTSEVGTKYYYVVITNSLNDTTASVTSGVATVVVEQDRVPDLIGDVIDSITNLPQMILDGIVGLFVPSEEAMLDYAERWDNLLAERFGAVYQSTTMVTDAVSALLDAGDFVVNTLNVPEVTVNLAGSDWKFGGWEVDPVPDGFEFLAEISKTASRIIASLAMFNGLRKRFVSLMTGSPVLLESSDPSTIPYRKRGRSR